MSRALESLRAFVRERAAEPTASPASTAPRAADRDRALDDLACTPLGAGDRSFVDAFLAEGPRLGEPARQQVARWPRERRRAVLLVQRCEPDRLLLWDPLEGAPLTLQLLEPLAVAHAERVRRGAVAVATWLPWNARLVAVGEVDLYGDPAARDLFREQVTARGTPWHEPPAPAPVAGD
jgi:hypothetical protein